MPGVEILERIETALQQAAEVLAGFTAGQVEHRLKEGGDPLTEADLAVNEVLLGALPRTGEGWLSEETADSADRLNKERVWVVDPIDGTREFIKGIPEWCVSVGLVERGSAVAGGILIPAREMTVLGAVGHGVRVNADPARVRQLETIEGVEILASRSEIGRGEWERFQGAPFRVQPMGSVACKLALVAAGLADATWTLVPKHEWDVAGGTALVLAAGGDVWTPDGHRPTFNRPSPKLEGLFAAPSGLRSPIEAFLRD